MSAPEGGSPGDRRTRSVYSRRADEGVNRVVKKKDKKDKKKK